MELLFTHLLPLSSFGFALYIAYLLHFFRANLGLLLQSTDGTEDSEIRPILACFKAVLSSTAVNFPTKQKSITIAIKSKIVEKMHQILNSSSFSLPSKTICYWSGRIVTCSVRFHSLLCSSVLICYRKFVKSVLGANKC